MEHSPTSVIIDCGTCVMFESAHCAECMVTYLCSEELMTQCGPQTSAVVFDLAELRAMKLLAEVGLVPTLRHRAVP